jgi:hypothetical protein
VRFGHAHCPVDDVVVDGLDWRMLAGFIRGHLTDDSTSPQLQDNAVALGIRIRVGDVGDLK